MSVLDALIPEPDLVEIDTVDVCVPPAQAWPILRHVDLGRSPLTRALFAVRAIPARLLGKEPEELKLRIDDIGADGRPGFRVLAEDPGREVAVGAIGKVWHLNIPFVDILSKEEFSSFDQPGFAKVAWALRVAPRGEHGSRIEFEVRVRATDSDSLRAFRRYFAIIGPASHFIRRHLLGLFGHELGLLDADENVRELPGDELLPDALVQVTDGITIRATPAAIWPWLMQMGCSRAGWYSIDSLDNAGQPSAREIHPELQKIAVGDVLPATPESSDGFEVLSLESPRSLVLGGLFDPEGRKQLRFSDRRPDRYWQVTWAFVLESLDEHTTRLHVRARAGFSRDERLHAWWIRPVHHLMQKSQLAHLAARAEGKLGPSARDIGEGVVGAAGIVLDLFTPFLRGVRSHWGVDETTAARTLPGDELVPEPRWAWTHGVEIDATPAEVWPWIAQIGADKAGFYSYEWLENLAGCGIRNAETTRADWEVRPGDAVMLHPKVPKLRVVGVEPGWWFVAHGAPDAAAQRDGKPWISVSWLFHLEPLDHGRTRFVSRFRSRASDDLVTRLQFGPYLTESVGFVMDRRMLLGVKERVERRKHEVLTR